MIQDQLDQAVDADSETRHRIVDELATAPGAFTAVLAALNADNWVADVAAEVIRRVGYPHNATAVPALLTHACNLNSPAAPEALEALSEMPPHAVVPYIIQLLWDRGITRRWWNGEAYTLAYVLGRLGPLYAAPCGPTISYLLSQRGKLLGLPVPALMEVFRVIGNESAPYALPVLIDLMSNDVEEKIANLARELIGMFAQDSVAPYVLVIPA